MSSENNNDADNKDVEANIQGGGMVIRLHTTMKRRRTTAAKVTVVINDDDNESFETLPRRDPQMAFTLMTSVPRV